MNEKSDSAATNAPESNIHLLPPRIEASVTDTQRRITRMERRIALRDEDAALDRQAMADLRQRIERLERRLSGDPLHHHESE